VSVNGKLVEDIMCKFKGECAHFRFNKCLFYTQDSASAKLSTSSHETDYSTGRSGDSITEEERFKGTVDRTKTTHMTDIKEIHRLLQCVWNKTEMCCTCFIKLDKVVHTILFCHRIFYQKILPVPNVW
jgi:hypothetical protein